MESNIVHTGVAIVFPATFPGSNAMSHCTLAFLGNLGHVDVTKRQLERHVEKLRADWDEMGVTEYPVESLEMFGFEQNVPVLVLDAPEVQDMRDALDLRLDDEGVDVSRAWPYRPHITRTESPAIPLTVKLHPPVLWWGDDRPKIIKEIPDIVKSHKVIETHHYMRRIKLNPGKVVKTRRNALGNRIAFRASSMTVTWRQGKAARDVVVYGHAVGAYKLACKRAYRIDKAPAWVKEVLNGVHE